LLEIDKIRKLVEMMVANDLVELALRDGDVEITLRRPTAHPTDSPIVGSLQSPVLTTTLGPGAMGAPPVLPSQTEDSDAELVEIKSPMVGTFYASPDPDSPPLVHVGSRVAPSSVVCLLEAMKVFSEIKAEIAGTIERILVKNAEAVEYGQALFLVRPA